MSSEMPGETPHLSSGSVHLETRAPPFGVGSRTPLAFAILVRLLE
jgi:hypothetical protein